MSNKEAVDLIVFLGRGTMVTCTNSNTDLQDASAMSDQVAKSVFRTLPFFGLDLYLLLRKMPSYLSCQAS